MCVSLGNRTRAVHDIAQSGALGFVGPNFPLPLVTAGPYFEAVLRGSSDVGNILVAALSSFPPRSIGVWNSDCVFGHLSISSSFLCFCCGHVRSGRNFLSRR